MNELAALILIAIIGLVIAFVGDWDFWTEGWRR
jgi:hypothetical protein